MWSSGTNLIKQGESVKGRPCGSVAQLAECSHGKRDRGPEFESRSGHDFFLPCDIWWLSVGLRLGQRASKCACLVVPSRFGDESN